RARHDARPAAPLLQGPPGQSRAGAGERQARLRQATCSRRARRQARGRASAQGPAGLKRAARSWPGSGSGAGVAEAVERVELGVFGEFVELVAADEPEAVGLVGVAEEEVGAVGGELGVVVGAAAGTDGGEVGLVVGAAPAAGDEVVDLEAGAAVAAGPAAVPVAGQDGG